tara:strand:+ start:456 stop:905 length:450 start_codon:yes stop_codon:yes gene_type:complete
VLNKAGAGRTKIKVMKKIVVFKTASWIDLQRSIKEGVWARRKGGLTNVKAGDIVVFQYKGDYYVTGIATGINSNLTVDVNIVNENWDSKDNPEGQFEFVPFKDLIPFTKQDFENTFKNSRTESKGKPVSIGYNHYIEVNDSQFKLLLNK